jgi:nucleoside-diphosphate-sugar epimerase
MKVLVIGASGMLISPVIRKMNEAGFDLRLFSRTVKSAASLFAYFEKVKEPEIPGKELCRLGKAETDFKAWI